MHPTFIPFQTYCSTIVFVCILPEKAVSKMTYTVSGGTLSPTHSRPPLSQPNRPVLDLLTLEGCKAELTLVLVIQDGLPVHRQSLIQLVTT